MTRYFFQTLVDGAGRDIQGTELESDDVARQEAVRLAGQILAYEPELVAAKGSLTVEVEAEGNGRLCTVRVECR